MITITCTTKKRRDGSIEIKGHTEIDAHKELLPFEMAGIFNEMWKADKEAFIDATDEFMEIRKRG